MILNSPLNDIPRRKGLSLVLHNLRNNTHIKGTAKFRHVLTFNSKDYRFVIEDDTIRQNKETDRTLH